ncbi:MAG: DUF1778 domain-containing protein [Deltaproteobacteria bacterium]|nr:DUF1778 domain-containing protein [Deltaproteobacteria bacterium]
MAPRASARTGERRAHSARLGFRVDEKTKRLVERAAELEHRNVTDYCLTALTDAARQTIEQHSSLLLSEADRVAFFDALTRPPKPNARLKRAVRRARQRIGE